jgi:hypothetical protein
MTSFKRINKLKTAFEDFFFEPASDSPLIAFRMSVAAVLLMEAVFIARNAFDLFGKSIEGGWNLGRFTVGFEYPRLQSLFSFFQFGSRGQSVAIASFGVLYIFLCGILCVKSLSGWKQRVSASICLCLNFFFINSNPLISYGIDEYTRWGLFYLVFAPKDPRRVRLLIRVIQIHLAITYIFNAWPKIWAPEWWSGDILYGVLNGPTSHFLDFSWMLRHQWLAQAMSFIALTLEAGFPVFIWFKKTRFYWALALISVHLMISVFMRLDLFGLLLAAMISSVFLIPADFCWTQGSEKTSFQKF